MLRLIKILFLLGIMCSCSESPTLSADSIDGQEKTVSIAYLRSLYNGAVTQIEENIAIEGYLVSSDVSGNFYHTMVFQDESGGVELSVELDNIFLYYTTHNMYRLHLKGLCIGQSQGNILLGDYSSDYPSLIYSISESNLRSYLSLVEYPSTEACDPENVSINALSQRHLSCLVCLTDVGFADNEVGLIANDTTEVIFRNLIDSSGSNLRFYVSPYASFASITLPSGRGMMNGIIETDTDGYYIKCSNYSDIAIEN